MKKFWCYLSGPLRTGLIAFSMTLLGACGGGSPSSAVVNDGPTGETVGSIVLRAPASRPAAGVPQTLAVVSQEAAPAFQWDFGDGNRQTGGPKITHTWNRTGRFTVTVTGVGKNGEALADSMEIEVASNATPSPCNNVASVGTDDSFIAGNGQVLAIRKYVNESDCPARAVDALSGLQAGNRVTRVFSNGTRSATSATTNAATADGNDDEAAHHAILESNRRTALTIERT